MPMFISISLLFMYVFQEREGIGHVVFLFFIFWSCDDGDATLDLVCLTEAVKQCRWWGYVYTV